MIFVDHKRPPDNTFDVCCFPRVLISPAMLVDGRDDFSRGYTITVCANGYAEKVAQLREPSLCSQDGFCISWQQSVASLL